MERRPRDGFTLIELLIVVVIIGILATIAIPRFSAVREESIKATMMSDLKNLAHHQEVYHNDHYTFSSSLTDLQAIESDGVDISINEADGAGWAATAVHAGVPGEQCGIYHGGATAANGAPATAPSVVQCTY